MSTSYLIPPPVYPISHPTPVLLFHINLTSSSFLRASSTARSSITLFSSSSRSFLRRVWKEKVHICMIQSKWDLFWVKLQTSAKINCCSYEPHGSHLTTFLNFTHHQQITYIDTYTYTSFSHFSDLRLHLLPFCSVGFQELYGILVQTGGRHLLLATLLHSGEENGNQ